LFPCGRMMSCGLHMRLIGHPARIKGLRAFMDYIAGFPDVWVCKREDIARHWWTVHPPSQPTATSKAAEDGHAAKL
jgi:allantoinase